MRFLKLCAALLLVPMALLAAPDLTISGRLLFDNAEFTCDRCMVSLLSGLRPVATTFMDLSGKFTFNNVPRGSYTIHAEIDGFETVNYSVEVNEGRLSASLVIPITRKPVTVSNGGPGIVNISQFLERYPKKAVSLFEKGSDSLKKKKYEDAIKYFRGALELAPTFYEAHHQLGVAYREAGRDNDAESEFLLAHELNSTAVEPLLNLTRLYLDENENERAVSMGEQAVKTNGRSASAFFSLGMALYKAAMLDRAQGA